MTQHTPGPWTTQGALIQGSGRDIATTAVRTYPLPEPEQKANALLMAAAPDLLEALQIWVRFFDEMPKGQFGNIVCDFGLLNDGFIKSDKAIKKAQGVNT